ncbi:uncharacterized protein [Solanum lycopersicum]|uniref:uncharacterized protein n=1 Tax=Solanum lycopersicum TaxID=4081 RepID=UPI003747845E
METNNVTMIVAAPTRTVVPLVEKPRKFSGMNFKGWMQRELQLILHDIIVEDMVVYEAFQVASMIEKLLPSWNDYKNYLNLKGKEMQLEDLDIGKGKGKSQANNVEEMEDADDLCARTSECNLVGNPKEWFLESGGTRHICSTKEVFTTNGKNNNIIVVVAAPTRTVASPTEKPEKFSDMVVNEAFKVPTMIEKLPNIRNYLKHKYKEIKHEDLVIQLKIDEGNKITKNKSRKSSTIIGVNIVEKVHTKDKK